MLSLQVYTQPGGGALLADFTGRARGLRFSTGAHGFAACDVPLVSMSLSEAFDAYAWPGLPHVAVSDGAGVVWEGRLEDIEIVAGGVHLMALGYQRALYDAPYTALWSKSSSADWRPVTDDELAAMRPERYEMDNNNRLFIAPKKGESFSNQTHLGALTFAVPHRSSTGMRRFTASYAMLLPSGWEFRVITYDDDFSSASVVNTVTATGSAQTGSIDLTLSNVARVNVEVRNNTGGASTISADTGTNYLKLTGMRLQALTADDVLASDIAAALAAWANTLNGQQLRGDAALIETTATGLRDEVYEDELPAAVLDRLALLHGYEWGVYDDRRLHFRPRGGQRHWYVDVTTTPQLQRSVENLRNSAYAVYRSADGRTLRTPNLGDADSQARYGLVRRGMLNVQTTSLTEAQAHRGVFLSDRSTLAARAEVEFDRLYDATGALWPLWAIRAGDTVTMRNLPPTLSTDIDRIRTFRVAETEYDAASGELSIAPEEPLPGLDVLVARREAGL